MRTEYPARTTKEIAPALQQHQTHDAHAATHHHSLLHKTMLGLGIIAAGVVIAPYVVNAFWPDPTGAIQSATVTMNTLCSATAGSPTGWAGAISNVLANVPLVGGILAEGGVPASLLTLTVGLGGSILGQYIDKKDDGTKSIRWGRVISTAALLTSALMGLPAIISGVSMSLIFFSSWLGEGALDTGISTLATQTLGMAGAATEIGKSTMSVLATHLLSCAAPLFSFFAAEETLRDAEGTKTPQEGHSSASHVALGMDKNLSTTLNTQEHTPHSFIEKISQQRETAPRTLQVA